MGAHLARAVRSMYPELNLRARLVLTGMAVSALDPDEKTLTPTDVSGMYFGSVEHRIEMCGPIEDEPRADDDSAEAHAARARRKTRKRVDSDTITELLRAGAIVMLRPPAPGRTTVYGLNLDPLTAPSTTRGGPSYTGEPVDWRRYSRSNARSTGASERTQLSGPTDAAQRSNGRSTGASRGVRGRGEPVREQPSVQPSSHQSDAESSANGDDDPELTEANRVLYAAGGAGTAAVVTTRTAHPTMTDRDVRITSAASLSGHRRNP